MLKLIEKKIENQKGSADIYILVEAGSKDPLPPYAKYMFVCFNHIKSGSDLI